MKAATEWTADDTGVTKISIHAAREGGDTNKHGGHCMKLISIHAAREGGDLIIFFLLFKYTLFQSTPPVKAATPYRFLCWENCWISIHAAREGGDVKYARNNGSINHFNPRRP